MSLKSYIKSNPTLKRFVHWMLIPTGAARPRIWVKLCITPIIHHFGRHSRVSRHARLDLLPFNKFSIGIRSEIEDFCAINNGVGDVEIGENTLIGLSNVIIGPIKIGNNIIFAQNIVASGLNHEYRNIQLPIRQQDVSVAPIIIEDDCWIASNAVITAGVTIGMHCVIAAGAVVTKDIPPYSVAAGNPARVIKKYDFDNKVWQRVDNG